MGGGLLGVLLWGLFEGGEEKRGYEGGGMG